jgi:hypothetical protein
MLQLIISMLISLNIISISEAQTITKDEVKQKVEIEAPQLIEIWELDDNE